MMTFDFIIPSQKDGLLNKTEINQYVVDEILSLREIPSALQGMWDICVCVIGTKKWSQSLYSFDK